MQDGSERYDWGRWGRVFHSSWMTVPVSEVSVPRCVDLVIAERAEENTVELADLDGL